MIKDGKLYVQTTCLVCLGKKTFCFYCNGGITYVEAADSVIKRWLHQQPSEVIDFITKAEENEK